MDESDLPIVAHSIPEAEDHTSTELGARRRMPLRQLAIVVAIVVVVLAVVVVTAGGSSSPLKPGSSQASATVRPISALLAGIPQNGNTLGSPTALVTLQYFGDLECLTAQAFTLRALPSIIRKWVRPGELRIEYRSLRTVSEPGVFGIQQVAALAAGMQDKLWYYLEDFYHEQGREHSGYVTEGYLRALARQVPGLNLELWGDDRHDPQLAPQVAEDEQAAHAAHLHSTPSFLIGRTGSVAILSLGQFATLDAINEAVRQVLHGQSDRGHRGPPTVVTFVRPLATQNNHL